MSQKRTRRRGCVCASLLALSACLAGSQARALPGPLGTQTSAGELVVVLDPAQNPRDILRRLADAGYPTLEVIQGIPARYHTYRTLKAPNNAETRAALMAVNGVIAVRPVYRAPEADFPILTNGQVIAKFRPGTTFAQVQSLAAQNDCFIVRQIQGLPQAYVLEPNRGDADPHAVALSLRASGMTVYAHPSIMVKLIRHQSAATNIEDPLYVFQWHLRNTGQLTGGRAGADISVEAAWQTTLGEGSRVAVIDDCVQRDHEDFKDNYITGFDFASFPEGQDGDPSPTFGPDPFTGFFFLGDPVGEAHGTSVAGLICARANTLGGRGVAPNAGLIGIKIGLGTAFSTDQDIADAFLFAERNGAMVINNSWGAVPIFRIPTVPNSTYLLPDLISDAIDEVATNGRSGRGVLVVFSAGNGDPLLFAPTPLPINFGNIYASLPTVMAVGATMRDDRASCYSNFGDEMSVMAPGGGTAGFSLFGTAFGLGCYDSDIATTDVMETPCFFGFDFDGDGQVDPGYPCRGYNPPMKFLDIISPTCDFLNDPTSCFILAGDLTISDFPQVNYTHHFNGTSAAAPVVSGVAALVFSVSPNLTAVQVKNLIEHTADKPGSLNETFDAVTGFNQRYGHGRVNAARAVQAAVAGQNWPSPVLNLQEVHSQSLARLLWTNPEEDVAGVLVVRSSGALNWAPVDGISYQVGQQVGESIVVVSNDLIESLDQTGLPSGNFKYALFVRNAQNFYSWGRRIGFPADNPVDVPVASISAAPRTGPVPLKVHFAGGGVDKGGIVGFNWDFGDGSTGTGPALDHTYTTGGTFLATLTVTNTVGQTAQTSVVIQPQAPANGLPTASISATPTTGNAPLVVVFRGVGTDADGFVTGYSWDFGDGSRATGQTVEHIYLVPGTYGAVLSVTDNSGGVGTASQIILVSGSAPTAGATDPPGLLNNRSGLCGFGSLGAVTLSLLGLSLMAVRRRF